MRAASVWSSAQWCYVIATIAAFVLTPEIRRVLDWRGNFDPQNLLLVIPLIMLLPIGVFALRRRERFGSGPATIVMLVWLTGFVYAATIALARGVFSAAVYDFAQFCLPVTVGAWLITRDETMETAYRRIARTFLILGVACSAYGIIQYIVAPEWDTTWMLNTDAEAFGTPERFGIRVFGFLNGPEIFAMFIGSVMLFNLSYLRARSWFALAAMLVMTVAVMLTLFRTEWIALSIGIASLVLLSPKRLEALARVAIVVSLCVAGALGALVASPDAGANDKITQRFSTLSDIAGDYSFNERSAIRDETVQKALEKPLGAGLGLTGGSGRLADPDVLASNDVPDKAIDNGFVARLFEMGIPGFAAFLLACCVSIGALMVRYRQFALARDPDRMLITASCITVQVVLFAVNFSDDDLHGLLGVVFFAAMALPFMREVAPSASGTKAPAPAARRAVFAG